MIRYSDIKALSDKDLWNLHDMVNFELDTRDATLQQCQCPDNDAGGDCEHCQSYYNVNCP